MTWCDNTSTILIVVNQLQHASEICRTRYVFVPVWRKLGVCSLSDALCEGSRSTTHLLYVDAVHWLSQNNVSTQVSLELSQLISLFNCTKYLLTNDNSSEWLDDG